jgi:hypothetical protein
MRVIAVATLACLVAASLSGVQGRTAAGDQPAASPPSSKSSAEVERRVRELIYVLRYHRVSVCTEVWTGAIRELVQIDKPAVPELVAELDRTDRPMTVRGLAFTLRAIGDPRAVAALIRVLDKPELTTGSDYGAYVPDPDLMTFMQRHRTFPEKDKNYFLYGRPINEISTTLAKLTKEANGTRSKWQEWWSTHKNDFPETDLHTRHPAPGDRDLIDEAGVARFGPLFPSGKNVELGPVHEVELPFDGYVNSRSYIDFDTGRAYQYYEGISADEAKSADYSAVRARWLRRTGVDAHCNASVTGIDLQLWLIDNSRWDTLPAEVHAGGRLNLGREATEWMTPFRRNNTDFREDQLGTFLFITRECGRGVIQCLPREDDATYACKIRYRLWGEKADHARAAAVRSAPRDESLWGPERTGILRAPGRSQAFLMSLESGGRVSPPDDLVPAEVPAFFSFANEKPLAAWCRAHGANLGTIVAHQGTTAPVKSVPEPLLTLIGLDMAVLSVSPDAYASMTVAELKALSTRWPAQGDQAWMIFTTEPRRDTYAIMTKSGTLGLLRIQALGEDGGGIAFHYRLAKERASKN